MFTCLIFVQGLTAIGYTCPYIDKIRTGPEFYYAGNGKRIIDLRYDIKIVEEDYNLNIFVDQ